MNCNEMIPAHIKVGAYRYKVVQRGDLWQRANEVYGQFHSTDQTIDLVVEGVSDVLILDTLTHEILHAIWWSVGLHDSDPEERVVTALATGYTGVLADNPDYVDYIQVVTITEREKYNGSQEEE
jgi:hypothetical protein